MDDLISRQAAIDVLCKVGCGSGHCGISCDDVHAIEQLPSAQPERKKGRWIWKGEEGDSRFMCSVCKSKEYVPTCNGVPSIWEFCPNCGARMEGEEDE